MNVELNSPVVNTQNVLVEDVGLLIENNRFHTLLKTGSPMPCRSAQVFSTVTDNQSTITFSLYRGTRRAATDNHFLGAYQISGFRLAPHGKPQIEVTFNVSRSKIFFDVIDRETGQSLNVTELHTQPTPIDFTFAGMGTVQVVSAYICGFAPDLVVGIQREGLWYLPGGVVEGPDAPKGLSSSSHFYPLEQYVKQQTGLQLTDLSDAVQVGMYDLSTGIGVTVLYVGKATGKLRFGQRLAVDVLPEFAVKGIDPRDAIQKIFKGKSQ